MIRRPLVRMKAPDVSAFAGFFQVATGGLNSALPSRITLVESKFDTGHDLALAFRKSWSALRLSAIVVT